MIELPGRIADQIREEAEAAYPRECCGLLVGLRTGAGGARITEAVPSPNLADPGRNDRFEIDPALHLRLQREARQSGQEVVGLYHSHPDGAAEPSQTDKERNWQPELLWLITVVTEGRAGAMNIFLQDGEGGQFRRLDLREI